MGNFDIFAGPLNKVQIDFSFAWTSNIDIRNGAWGKEVNLKKLMFFGPPYYTGMY